jgi:hypothetical protein
MEDSYLESTRRRIASRTKKGRGCWLWTGALSSVGYGHLSVNGKVQDAHRVLWMIEHGPIPEGGVIAHRCDNRACVRLDHLFLTDDAGNLADMRAKWRHSHGASHGAAIRTGWTAELRAMRAEQTRARNAIRQAELGTTEDAKFCPRCQTVKPRSDFHRNAARPDGIKPHCKPCSIAMEIARRKHKS